MEFYIKINNSWVSQQIEINPTLMKAFDTTNDSFNVDLKANSQEQPYNPMTPFKVVYDDNSVQIFWVINDSVSLFSLNPVCYKHTLSLVQYRHFLHKHIIRNTVFNQPKKTVEKTYTALTINYQKQGGQDGYYQLTPRNSSDTSEGCIWYDDVLIEKHNKVKNLSMKVKYYGINHTGGSPAREMLEVSDVDMLEDYNVQLRGTVLIAVLDTLTNHQFGAYYLTDFVINQDKINKALANAINTYLQTHDTVNIRGVYYVQNSPTTLEQKAFADPIDKTVTLSVAVGVFHYVTLQFEIKMELYTWTMYDVLETLVKQYRLESSLGYKRDEMFLLPRKTGYDDQDEKDLYDLLTTTYPPDTLNFTQATFYDALTEIFRFYDAGFKFDENKRIQIEYYNDPQVDRTEDLVDEGVFIASGKQLSHADKNFNNGRVAYYQNAIKDIEIKNMATRCESYGVPQKSEYVILLPKPIYDIEKLEFLINQSVYFHSILTDFNFALDITRLTINSEVWSTLPLEEVDFDGYNWEQITQNNTIKYDRGSHSINISTYFNTLFNIQVLFFERVVRCSIIRFFGYYKCEDDGTVRFQDLADDWYKQKFNIKYKTQNNGRSILETPSPKYVGEQIVNQNDGLIDLNKLGINAFGESLKDGEPVLTLQCQITDWNDRIKEGDYFIKDNEKWVANVVNYQVIKNGVYNCSVEFSKNFNALSMRVRSNKEKRLTNIAGEISTMSEDNFVDYVYVSSIADHETITTETTSIPLTTISYNIAKTFKQTISGNYDVNIVCFSSDDLGTSNIDIPTLKYGFGNCICFELQYNHPVNAGNRLRYQSSKYFSLATPYTDDYGWAETFTLTFYAITDDGKKLGFTYTYPYMKLVTDIGDPIPGLTLLSEVGKIQNLKYYKKPNEIFGLNYELCFLALPSEINTTFIGNTFINDNNFTKQETAEIKNFYLHYTTNGNDKYSISNLKGKGSRTLITDVGHLVLGNQSYLSIKVAENISAKTWSICDDNGFIYFASNEPKEFVANTSKIVLYFFTRKTRI